MTCEIFFLIIFLSVLFSRNISQKEKIKLAKGKAIVEGKVSNFENTSKVLRFAASGIVKDISQTAILDSLGNVPEWTNSFSELYPNYRIFRGGSWRNDEYDFVVYLIGEGGPELATNYIGFRCVK